MTPGKRFEAKFHRSLELLDGWCTRFRDNSAGFGGKYGGGKMNQANPGDFLFIARNGRSYLVECKATKQRSFPFANVSDDQLAELLRFERMGATSKAYIAINFYQGDTRLKNECILVGIEPFLAYRKATTRKSLPEDEAERIGWRCEVIKGNIWSLPFGKRL